MKEDEIFWEGGSKEKRMLISKFIELVNERYIQRRKFINSLLVVTSTVFAVVITLGNGAGGSFYSLWLYRCCTVINGLSILFYCIVLYESIVVCNQHVHRLRDILVLPDHELIGLGGQFFVAITQREISSFHCAKNLPIHFL